ncbi:GNAT family N-acetyltransferase [Ruminococcus sp.]|uniref:GNAT family N-acetyltransferase n=1 Tax=Ruminococcus sp. TaxID=41978 RepID=UPI0025DA80E1|nr:GNAT family N-acetyltransferase [Ruminococcus sp.]
MILTVYTLEQVEQWDAIVRSFNEYDSYWLSGYVKAFHIHGDGEPLLFYYDDGKTRGINVVMKRDVANDERFKGKIEENRYFDFSTPYGYGGWIIEGNEVGELFKAYSAWLERNGIISEFVRFHPMLHNNEKCSDFYEVVQLGEVVHMDLNSPDEIWNNIISKNRNMIRKAIKNDIKIYNGRFPEIYEKFRIIYNSTMDKDDAEKYYYFSEDFYKSVLEDLPQNAQVFWAEKDGQVIAASIMLAANGRMNYHLSGSMQEYSSLAPTNLLLYQAALWGCANNYKTLYLGGGVGSGEDSLFKFKRAFYKGELNSFFIGKKIYDLEKYNELVGIRGDISSGFFPKYRA